MRRPKQWLPTQEHGTDRPAVVQYVDWLASAVQGDFGESLAQSVPVWDIVQPALANSLKLALFAFSSSSHSESSAGSWPAFASGTDGPRDHRDRALAGRDPGDRDRSRADTRLLDLARLAAGYGAIGARRGTGDAVKHLTLPALALVIVLFGYIARITRAGVVEALDADYTRTAYLKGFHTSR